MNMNKKIKLTVSLSEDEYYRAHSIIKNYLGISIHEFIRLTVRHAANLKELDTKDLPFPWPQLPVIPLPESHESGSSAYQTPDSSGRHYSGCQQNRDHPEISDKDT